MSKLNITDAAKQWNISRQTIYNRLNEGILSATVDANGVKEVDVSEMVRVFGEPTNKDPILSNKNAPIGDALGTLRHRVEIETLKREAAESRASDLEGQVHSLRRQIERIEQRQEARDKQLETALENVNASLRLLNAPATPAQEPKRERKSIIDRLLKV